MLAIDEKYKNFLKEFEELGTLFPSSGFDPYLIQKMIELENDEITSGYSELKWEELRHYALRNYALAISVLKCNNSPTELKEELIDFIPRDALFCVLKHNNLSRKCYEKAIETMGSRKLVYFLDMEDDLISERAKGYIASLPDSKQKEIDNFGYNYMRYENPSHRERIDKAIRNVDTDENILLAIADNNNLPDAVRESAYENIYIVDDFACPTLKMKIQMYHMLTELIFDFNDKNSDKSVRDEAQGRLYYGFSYNKFPPSCQIDYVERFIHDPFAMDDSCMQILADKSKVPDVLTKIADYDGKLASIMEMREDINEDVYDIVNKHIKYPEEQKKWFIKSTMKTKIPKERVLELYKELPQQEIILAYISSVKTPVQDGYFALLKTGMQDKAKVLQYFKRTIDPNIKSEEMKQVLLSTMLKCITEKEFSENKKYADARFRNNYFLINISDYDAIVAKEATENIKKLYPEFEMEMNAFNDKIDDALLKSSIYNAVPKIYFIDNDWGRKETIFYLSKENLMELNEDEREKIKEAIKNATKDVAINFRDALFGILDSYRQEDMDDIHKFIYKYADIYEALIEKIQEKEKEVRRDDTER